MYQCKSCWPPAPVSYHGGGGCAPDSRLRLIHAKGRCPGLLSVVSGGSCPPQVTVFCIKDCAGTRPTHHREIAIRRAGDLLNGVRALLHTLKSFIVHGRNSKTSVPVPSLCLLIHSNFSISLSALHVTPFHSHTSSGSSRLPHIFSDSFSPNMKSSIKAC